MVLDESNNKVTESNISLNEEQEMEFISQIKPATLTMIASILSDMVYVEGGELILTNQNSQAFDLRREASEKLKEVRADLDTAAKMIQKSKQDLKKANRESIGLIKEKDIKKVDEKKLSAEKGLEQLSEIKRKSEEEIEYYSSIISQNSNSKKTVSGFWQMRNCVGANAMRVLGIEVDRYSNENDSYTYDDAELFVRRFCMLTTEKFHIPEEEELFISNGGSGSNICSITPTPIGTKTCKAKNVNRSFKRVLGCEWVIRQERLALVPKTDNLVFYTSADKMISTASKPSGLIKAIIQDKKLDSSFDSWLNDHNCFRIACSTSTYERLARTITNQLRCLVDEFVGHQKTAEYKKLFIKNTIRFIDKPVTSQLYTTLLLLETLGKPGSNSFYPQWSSHSEESLSEEKLAEVVKKLNTLFNGKYTFEQLSFNKSAFTSLRNNGLIGEGEYLCFV